MVCYKVEISERLANSLAKISERFDFAKAYRIRIRRRIIYITKIYTFFLRVLCLSLLGIWKWV